MIRKWLLRLLLGGDPKTWNEVFTIAVECSESCRRTLKREAYLLGRYSTIVDRENKILDAVQNSSDYQLKSRILEILDEKEETNND